MATLPNVPDLPTPITPDRDEPIELPVEPDRGMLGLADARFGGRHSTIGGMSHRFLANRQFMTAATFRWSQSDSSVSAA